MSKNIYGNGQEEEQEFASYLIGRGHIVIPISSYQNNTGGIIGAPMMMLPDGKVIAPDLFAMKNGKHFFVEVKGKSVPAYFYRDHQYVHGVDLPNARAYQKISIESGYPLYIALLEKDSPRDGLLWVDLAQDGMAATRRVKENLQSAHTWLWIPIEDAFLLGKCQSNNSAMKNPSNPEGWGLYWPRSAMKQLQLHPNASQDVAA